MDERLFISYKRANKDIVFKIKDDIEKNVGEKCWIDLDGIESDVEFANVIMKAINKSDVFLFMYSQMHDGINDFENDWTIRELRYAKHKKKRIVFLNIDNSPLFDWVVFLGYEHKQQVDVTSMSAMGRLYSDLSKWLGYKGEDNTLEEVKKIIIEDKEVESDVVEDGMLLHEGKEVESDVVEDDMLLHEDKEVESDVVEDDMLLHEDKEVESDVVEDDILLHEDKEVESYVVEDDVLLQEDKEVESDVIEEDMLLHEDKEVESDVVEEDMLLHEDKEVEGDVKEDSNVLFQKDKEIKQVTVENGHEYVDLGLSVKWATCNIGAESPEDSGDYFAWGEVELKKKYSYKAYKFTKGGNFLMTSFVKYTKDDRKNVLDIEDDVAHVKWGGKWRMPTKREFKELKEKCTWEKVGKNSKLVGYKVIGPNGNSIFLPAAGEIFSRNPIYYREKGLYWSNSLDISYPSNAYYLQFDEHKVSLEGHIREEGFSVRPVCLIEDKEIKQVTEENLHEYVDLGLSVKWATCNVGANSPEGIGDYYAWGEDSQKTIYKNKTYKFISKTGLFKYTRKDSKKVLDLEDDVAHVKWGGKWRMPTVDELRELKEKCTWERIMVNSKLEGYNVIGPSGKSIFLPAVGYKNSSSSLGIYIDGYYWSSSRYIERYSESEAWLLFLGKKGIEVKADFREYGCSVRPVCP